MEDNYVDNLNKLREIANNLKSLDILDPSSRTIMLVTEMVRRAKLILINRLKNCSDGK